MVQVEENLAKGSFLFLEKLEVARERPPGWAQAPAQGTAGGTCHLSRRAELTGRCRGEEWEGNPVVPQGLSHSVPEKAWEVKDNGCGWWEARRRGAPEVLLNLGSH